MNYSKFSLLFVTFIIMFTYLNMTSTSAVIPLSSAANKHYAAILYDGQVLVDTFSTTGKCKIPVKKEGKLSISSLHVITETLHFPILSIDFQVAIKNKDKHTLFMLTKAPVSEISAASVLAQCKKGDRLVFIIADKQYTLLHYEVEISWNDHC